MNGDKPIYPAQPDHGHYSREGIVGDWLLNEGGGDKVGDSTLNGNNGTLFGPTWANGPSGPVLRFDGTASDNHVIVPALPLGTSPFTLRVKANFRSLGENNSGYLLHFINQVQVSMLSPAGFEFRRNYTGTNSLWRLSGVLAFGEVDDVVFVWLGNNDLKIYINGVLKSPTLTTPSTLDPVPVTADLWIGNNNASLIRQLDADISIVEIYNRALSAAEIKSLFDNPYAAWRDTLAIFAAAQGISGISGIPILRRRRECA